MKSLPSSTFPCSVRMPYIRIPASCNRSSTIRFLRCHFVYNQVHPRPQVVYPSNERILYFPVFGARASNILKLRSVRASEARRLWRGFEHAKNPDGFPRRQNSGVAQPSVSIHQKWKTPEFRPANLFPILTRRW